MKPIKRIRDNEYAEVDELKDLKMESHYMKRFMSDQKIRQTSKFSEVEPMKKKFALNLANL